MAKSVSHGLIWCVFGWCVLAVKPSVKGCTYRLALLSSDASSVIGLLVIIAKVIGCRVGVISNTNKDKETTMTIDELIRLRCDEAIYAMPMPEPPDAHDEQLSTMTSLCE